VSLRYLIVHQAFSFYKYRNELLKCGDQIIAKHSKENNYNDKLKQVLEVSHYPDKSEQ